MQITAFVTASALLGYASALITVERGCSQDFFPDRRVFTLAQTSSNAMTFELCRDFCLGKNAEAFGLEFSRECYCAAPGEYATLQPATNTCSKPCSGNPSTLCGGDNALQVYTFEPVPPATYIGCARDYFPDSRVLSGPFYQDDGDNSNAKCQEFCFSAGFPLAGTEYSDECFCGTAADRNNLTWADNCDEACTSGDGICGGHNAISLYTMDDTVPPMVSSSVPPYVTPTSSARVSTAATSSPASVPSVPSVSTDAAPLPSTTSVVVVAETSSAAVVPVTTSVAAIPTTTSVPVVVVPTTTSAPVVVIPTTTAQVPEPTTTRVAQVPTTVQGTTTAKVSTLTTSTRPVATTAAPGSTKLCFISFEVDEVLTFVFSAIGGAVLDLLTDAFVGAKALVLSKSILSSIVAHETTVPDCPISKTLFVEFYYKSSSLYVGKTCSLVATVGVSSTTIPINGGKPWTKASFQSSSISKDLKVKFELKCTSSGWLSPAWPLLPAPVSVDSVTIKY